MIGFVSFRVNLFDSLVTGPSKEGLAVFGCTDILRCKMHGWCGNFEVLKKIFSEVFA